MHDTVHLTKSTIISCGIHMNLMCFCVIMYTIFTMPKICQRCKKLVTIYRSIMISLPYPLLKPLLKEVRSVIYMRFVARKMVMKFGLYSGEMVFYTVWYESWLELCLKSVRGSGIQRIFHIY